MHLMTVNKSRKRSGFVTYLYFKDSAFTAVKRDAKFYERGNFSVKNLTA